MNISTRTTHTMLKFRYLTLPWLLATALHLSPALAAAPSHTPMWLSDAPGLPEYAQRLRRSHGGMIEMGRGGATAKRLWLRGGDSPTQAMYLMGYEQGELEYHLTTPDNQRHRLQPFDTGHYGFGLHFDIPDEGFYSAYAIRREVRDGILHIETAKAEVLRHLCSAGHDYPAGIMEPRPLLAEAPLEVIRHRLDGENFHSRLVPGDTLQFTLYLHGEPAEGVEVRLITGQNWSKAITTGSDGVARFQLIRDYYPQWELFNRRREDPFLLIANYRQTTDAAQDARGYRSIHYTTTFTGQYSPPPREYQSYAYGLGLASLAFIIGTASVVVFRRRRWKKPQEEAFDEKA